MHFHGADGISEDYDLTNMWTNIRTRRIPDEPAAVHRRKVARAELKKYTNSVK